MHLRKANQLRELIQIVVTFANYTSSSSLFTTILHLEGEEVFGVAKCKANLPLGLEANSHWHDRMNFFCLKVANVMAPIN